MDKAKVAKITRPDIVDNEYMLYLDTLRDSGVTNMFGAGEFLQQEFALSRVDARVVLKYWMDTF